MSLSLPPLLGYQSNTVDRISEIRSSGIGRSILAVAPPGAGKSRTMMELADQEFQKGNRSLIKVHRRMLLEQMIKGFVEAGYEIGVIAPDYKEGEPIPGLDTEVINDLDAPILIGSTQTLFARTVRRSRFEFPKVSLVVNDEAHQQTGKQERALAYGAFTENGFIQEGYLAKGATLVGFTATPLMNQRIYTDLIQMVNYSELRKQGMHLPIQLFGPDEIDTSGLKVNSEGEFKEQDLEPRVQAIFGSVHDEYLRLNPNKLPSILFAPSVQCSKWFCYQLSARGIPCGHIDGESILMSDGNRVTPYAATKENRTELLRRSRTGEIKIMCNRFVLREAIDCLDSETEVLTESGWRGINDHWHSETKVWTLNKNSQKAELLPINGMFSRQRRPEERMVAFRSQHSDIRVTEGHRMHIKYFDPSLKDTHGNTGRFSKTWLVKHAREMVGRSDFAMPVAAKKDSYEGTGLSEDWIELLGWWVSDGSTSLAAFRPQLFIHQKKLRWIPRIRQMLYRLGVDYKEFKKKSGAITFSISGKQVWPIIGKYLSKSGTKEWDRMNRSEFYVFWKALCRGDGQVNARRPGNKVTFNNLTCGNKVLADYLMQLGVLRGARMSCSERVSSLSGNAYWALYMKASACFMSSRPNSENSIDIKFEEDWKPESVWCVNNDNDTLITRRRGKVAIIGNCPWLYHAIFATVMGSTTTALQSVGRLQRFFPGYAVKILQDHGGFAWRHGSPNSDRYWQLGNTNSSYAKERIEKIIKGEIPEGMRCPKCSMWRTGGPVCPNESCRHASSQSVRAVRMVNGKLKHIKGSVFTAENMVERAKKLWKYWLWRGGKAGMTVGGIVAACGDDARKKGIKVDFNSVPWKPPAADSMEWHRLARDHWPWLKSNKKKVEQNEKATEQTPQQPAGSLFHDG